MCSVIAGLMAVSGFVQQRAQEQQIKAQASAQANMYRAQADAAAQNARIENRKQEQIADNYAQQQDALRTRRRLAEGAQRAETGAAGLNFAGSSMDILSSGYDAYKQDAMNLLGNQRNDNYSSRVAESNYINQMNSSNAAANNVLNSARKQIRMSRISSILGTATSIIGATQPWKSAGGAGQSAVGSAANGGGWSPIARDMGYGTTAFYNSKTGYSFGTDFLKQPKFGLGSSYHRWG
nr:MAG TPA: hypothetical protein [Caudoviricetes sp.]